ncbi:class I SAM-dependent methyltransferase [Cohnella nanjingensis]|uniref:Class I SAM-dependent methyltransferase n=2 Tax=Cohnella nanjingensis TaxID=1387779 RepID=A0A7X0RPT9_9BACL|nr:class I SAM-dependent methyltransferase [Cohnella nanjingensis]
MSDHESIYRHEAEKYDKLISAQPSLRERINAIRPLAGLDVIDLGAGTGRLTVPLAVAVRSILAVDAAEDMLRVAAHRLQAAGSRNWRTAVGEHRRIPATDDSADLLVSGWSVCYSTSAEADPTGGQLAAIVAEMRRVLRPCGTAVLFETMGTGFEEPNPPAFLLDYYAALEREHGFAHDVFRLDYTFADAEEAERLTRFFFGDELGDRTAERGSPVVPEYAGVWWRTFA